jgi:hypothetical protein
MAGMQSNIVNTVKNPVYVPQYESNYIVINNGNGSTVTNYPLQIGRAFRQGELTGNNYPSFSINNSVITTQANVKNRWSDGSIKFAVMTAVIPSVSANTKVTANIVANAQTFGGNADPRKLLVPALDFEIKCNYANGIVGNTSVRSMIAANAYTVWETGPVSTTWIFADHTTKAFDVGNDANASIRPIIHVQSWENMEAYRVRVIFEGSDTSKLQDQTYSVNVTTGNTSPTVRYTSPLISHPVGTRWTREFWFGANAPSVTFGIGHNVGYLASTKAIPNYDPAQAIYANVVSSFNSSWASAAKQPYQNGFWQIAMASAGGRGDIGTITNWNAIALYTDDGQAQKNDKELTDLAAAWPMHFRSGSATKLFDDVTAANGLGLPVTRDGYPTQFFYQGNAYLNTYFVNVADRFTFVGTYAPNPWSPDGAHQPDPHYTTYLLTGDFYYLEQLQFWASWGLFNTNPGSSSWASGRNPKDTIINDQVRSNAWLFRTRARAGFISPDNSPAQAYFTRATEQALRMWEGSLISTGSDPIRAWWATNFPRFQPWPTNNPLRLLDAGGGYAVDPNTDILGASAIWMYSMFCQSLGHLQELGYNSSELLAWFAQLFISMSTTPGVDGRHLADYNIPTGKGSKSTTTNTIGTGPKVWVMNQPIAPNVVGDTVTLRYDSLNSMTGTITSYNSETGELIVNVTTTQQYNLDTYSSWYIDLGLFKTWQDAFDDLTGWTSSWEGDLGDLTHGYTIFAISAVSYLFQQPGGAEAWEWAKDNGYSKANWRANPKMAIIPRLY